MKVSLIKKNSKTLVILARAEGKNAVGDLELELTIGQTFFNTTFSELIKYAPGQVEISAEGSLLLNEKNT